MRVFDTSSLYFCIKKGEYSYLENSYGLELSKYEFGNIIWKEIALFHIFTEEEGEYILQRFHSLIKRMKLVYPDYKESLSIAVRFHLPYYDASFVQTAKKYNVPLITEDKKIIHAVKNFITAYPFDALGHLSPD